MANIPTKTPAVTLPPEADYPRVPTEFFIAQMANIGITVSNINGMSYGDRIRGLRACAAVIEAHKPMNQHVTLYKGDGPPMPADATIVPSKTT